MTRIRTRKIAVGTGRTIDSSDRRRAKRSILSDRHRLVRLPSLPFPPPWTELIDRTVWCWGWDGAGDLEGPDVEPIWEALPNSTFDPRLVRQYVPPPSLVFSQSSKS